MSPTIYVITYYDFNHGSMRPENPLSPKFLESDKNYVYYLIDKQIPSILEKKQTILEYDLDPMFHEVGGKHLGEWSFLLAEEKHAFCKYPLFMISSRFYEKNQWLKSDLNQEWDRMFSLLQEYGWGYLPCYNRPIRWIDLSWEKAVRQRQWEYTFYPFREKTYQLTKEIFRVDIPNDYGFTADLFCNYIGFRSREELLAYVNFYRPLLNYFFREDYSLRRDFAPYIYPTGGKRNEKPFAFFLELLSHLFFFKNQIPYFALHYDGYYAVDEFQKKLKCIEPFSLSLKTRIHRFFQWQWHRLHTEGFIRDLRGKVKRNKFLYKIAKATREKLKSFRGSKRDISK